MPLRPADEPLRVEGAGAKRVGLLDLYCEPDCEVFLGNKRIGSTPLRRFALPAGRHRLSVRNRLLGLRKSVAVEIVPGRTTARTVNLVLDR